MRIPRTLSQDKPHVETVTCYKLRPDHAEHSAMIWAQRWIDLQLRDGPEPAPVTLIPSVTRAYAQCDSRFQIGSVKAEQPVGVQPRRR